jgi:hypothetical protein
MVEYDAQFEASATFPDSVEEGQNNFLPPMGTKDSVIITRRATANPIMMKTVGLGIYNLYEIII